MVFVAKLVDALDCGSSVIKLTYGFESHLRPHGHLYDCNPPTRVKRDNRVPSGSSLRVKFLVAIEKLAVRFCSIGPMAQ